MLRKAIARAAILILACPLGACARSTPTSSYGLAVHVDGDPGHPLEGATVSYRGQSVGHTDPAGTLALAIRGSEGERVSLRVSCPDGFLSPDQPTEVVLHRLAEAGRRPEYDVRCPPITRRVALVVRADHGPHLPVLYLGKEVARTDESGAAHALVSVPANEDVEVTIGTGEPGSERLRPQSPSMKFASSDQDDVKVLSVAFALEPEKPRLGPARSLLPIRLH
jgi:hypothetical protein